MSIRDCLNDTEVCIHCGQYHDIDVMDETDKGFVCMECIDFHNAIGDEVEISFDDVDLFEEL